MRTRDNEALSKNSISRGFYLLCLGVLMTFLAAIYVSKDNSYSINLICLGIALALYAFGSIKVFRGIYGLLKDMEERLQRNLPQSSGPSLIHTTEPVEKKEPETPAPSERNRLRNLLGAIFGGKASPSKPADMEISISIPRQSVRKTPKSKASHAQLTPKQLSPDVEEAPGEEISEEPPRVSKSQQKAPLEVIADDSREIESENAGQQVSQMQENLETESMQTAASAIDTSRPTAQPIVEPWLSPAFAFHTSSASIAHNQHNDTMTDAAESASLEARGIETDENKNVPAESKEQEKKQNSLEFINDSLEEEERAWVDRNVHDILKKLSERLRQMSESTNPGG